jgi:chemotaxis protein histidine kinase CheA
MEPMPNTEPIVSHDEGAPANKQGQLVSGYALESVKSVQFPIDSESSRSHVDSTQQILSRIYEVFSHRFPSPQVVQERELQKVRETQNTTNATVRPYRGIFGRLFGRSQKDSGCLVDEKNEVVVSEQLEETDGRGDDNNDNERSVLHLDTDSIDGNVIPAEAHHCARLYLSSIKSRAYSNSSYGISANYKVCSNESKEQTSVCVIVGLGRVLEIPTSPIHPSNDEGSLHERSMIAETNDREALLQAQEYYSNPHSPMVPCVDLVRCAQLSENCIAVSWGMEDGIVVIYRRVKFDDGRYGWHSIAMISPQQDVIDSVRNVCMMARVTGTSHIERKFAYESGLLRVSQIMPLHLAPSEMENNTVLVVGRLGGYLEFIVIPSDVCQGPVLRPRQQKLRGFGHYASHLPNICEDRRLSHGWWSTSEVQSDITSMAVLKKKKKNTKQGLHMDNLSTEYILCTSGMSTASSLESVDGCESSRLGCECLALWRFMIEAGGKDKYSMQFALLDHSIVPEVGPEVSIFVSKRTISNWVPNSTRFSPTMIYIAPPVSDLQMSSLHTSNSVFVSILHYNYASPVLHYTIDPSISGSETTTSCNRLRVLKEEQEHKGQLIKNHDTIVTTGWWYTENAVYLVQGTSQGHLMLKQIHDRGNNEIDFRLITSVHHPVSNISIVTKSFPQTKFTVLGCKNTKVEKCITLYQVGQMCLTNYIQSLISQECLEEALALAQNGNLTVANVPVVEELRVCLWEKRYDVESFKMIFDDKYVMQQAYCIDVLGRQNSDIGADVIHEILGEALLRISTAESKNNFIDQKLKSKIINDLIYLGTFLRLSQLLDIKNVSASRFTERFLPIDLLGLAKSFAVHGDVRSVCLLVSRHSQFWESITTVIEVLNCLPLSLPVHDFEMLLPDASNANAQQWWSKITDFAENYLLMQVFDDPSEKSYIKATISRTKGDRDDVNLISWYLERARRMANFFGLLDSTVTFLNKAVESIGEEIVDDRNENIVFEISSLRASLYHIHSIVELGMHLDTALVQRMQSMSVREFESLGVSDAIELILGGCTNEQEFMFRYKEILFPMFSLDDLGPDYVIRCWPDLVTGEACYNFDRKNELELGIVLFCLRNLQNSVDVDSTNNHGCAQSALTALNLCEVIVKGSSTKIPLQERLIGDTLILMQFVLDVAKTIGDNLRSYHIKVLWRLYECMPEYPYSGIDVDGWKCLSWSLDSLFRSLLGLDICQKWLNGRGNGPVTLNELQDAHQMWSNNPNLQLSTYALSRLGSKLLISMCEGFTRKCKELSDADTDVLFLCFMSDVSDLNDYCCYGLLHIEDTFSLYLVTPLLEANMFDMLRRFVLTGWVSHRLLCAAIEIFARDVSLKTDDGRYLHLISKCRQCFENVVPRCSSTLKSLQEWFSYLALFRNNFQGSRCALSALGFKSSPLSSIVYVLENEPDIITLQDPDCEESQFPSSTITEVLNKFKSLKTDSSCEVLSFPSVAVLNFASILGLGDPRSQFIVKGLIAKFACYHRMYAVALAINTIMLCNVTERTCSQFDDSAEEFLLQNISSAASLSCLTHRDIVRDLCKKAICWWDPERCRADIVDTFTNIIELCGLAKIEPEVDNIHETSCGKIFSAIESIMNQINRYSIPLSSITEIPVNGLMEHILAWSATSLVSVNKDERHLILTVLEFWMYMVFVLNVIVDPITLLSRCLDDLERSEKLTIDSMKYKQTSESIVDKLVHLGYTVNAARRAAIYTENQNSSSALLWAVAHANDADFNDPLPILKEQFGPSHDRYLFQESLILPKQIIKNALHYGAKFALTNRSCHQLPLEICDKYHENDEKDKSSFPTESRTLNVTNNLNGHSATTANKQISLKTKGFHERSQCNVMKGGGQLRLEQRKSLLAAEGRKLLEKAKEKSNIAQSIRRGTEIFHKVANGEQKPTVEKAARMIQQEEEAERLRKQAEAEEKKRAAEEAARIKIQQEEEAERLRKQAEAEEQKRAAEEAARIKIQQEEEAERLRKQAEAEEVARIKREQEEEAERLRKQAEAEEQKRAAEEAARIKIQQEEEAERLRKQAEAEEKKRAAEEVARIKREQEEEADRLRKQAEVVKEEERQRQQRSAEDGAEIMRNAAIAQVQKDVVEVGARKRCEQEEEAERLCKVAEAGDEVERHRCWTEGPDIICKASEELQNRPVDDASLKTTVDEELMNGEEVSECSCKQATLEEAEREAVSSTGHLCASVSFHDDSKSLNCRLEQKDMIVNSNSDEISLGVDKDAWGFDRDLVDIESSISLSSPLKSPSSASEIASGSPNFASSNYVIEDSNSLRTFTNLNPNSNTTDSDNEGWDFDF